LWTAISRLDPAWLGVASVFLWLLVFDAAHPTQFADEHSHLAAILGIREGEWRPPPYLPMLTGYHWIVALISWVPGPSLSLGRLISACLSSAAILFFAAAKREWEGERDGRATLSFAWLPILFPFTVMVYTDVAGVLFIVAAVWAKLSGRLWLSALFLLVAFFVRQSNIVWALFVTAWVALDTWEAWRAADEEERRAWSPAVLTLWFPRLFAHLAAVGFMGFFFLTAGSLLPAPVEENRPQPNIGNLYLFCFTVLLVWAPLWVPRLPKDLRALTGFVRLRSAAAAGIGLGLAGLSAVLVATYDNFHPWNHDERFIRNLPLIWMQEHVWLRVIGVLLTYWALWFLVRFWREQPERRLLLLLGGFLAVFLAPHVLVETRYYMVPFALAYLLISLPKREGTWLAGWSFVLSLAAVYGAATREFW
jgi:hypothetical protein